MLEGRLNMTVNEPRGMGMIQRRRRGLLCVAVRSTLMGTGAGGHWGSSAAPTFPVSQGWDHQCGCVRRVTVSSGLGLTPC